VSAPVERLVSALEARDLRPKRSGANVSARCPAHEDKRASLSVGTGDDGRALVKCHAGCETADVLAALGLEEKALFPEREKRRPVKKSAAAVEFTYHAADGTPLAKKFRFELADGKSFGWKRRNGDGWTAGLNGQKPPLFGLPVLIAAVKAGGSVHVVEGEKCATALAAMGLVSTTAAGGAGDALDAPGLLEPLQGADVVLWPDLDEPGRQYVERFARKLSGLARRVRTIKWPGDRPKGFDVADYIAGGANRGDLDALVTAAAEFSATAPENAATLLRDVLAFVHRYVVLTPEQEVAVTLWTFHTWAAAAVDVSPYLSVTSAVLRAGKTRLLETLELVVRNPWRVVQPSEAVLFRKLGQGDMTLLFDEVDAIFGRNVSDSQEGIRAVLNCGFQRGATVPRCTEHGREVEEFSVFGPKLLAGIGALPPTVKDRSFVIEMKRKKRTEAVSRFRHRDAEALAAPLRKRLERWADAAIDSLRNARPDLPEQLGDRAQDAAEPLLAIADAAGTEWPELARQALISLAGEDDGDDDELGLRLLADVRAVFQLLQRTDGDIPTATLLSELHSREESPWKKYHKGEPLDPAGLARLLKPFGVRPRRIRVGEGTVRGYLVPDFADPFERYLPSDPLPATPATAPQRDAGGGGTVAPYPPQDPPQSRRGPDSPMGAGSCGGSCGALPATDSTNNDSPCGAVAGRGTSDGDDLARRRFAL
jgi:hypothetical protein